MTSVTIAEAQARLMEIVHQIGPGEEIVITENDQPVAKLVGKSREQKSSRAGPGALKGMVTYMADDFGAPLADMKEYME